MRNKLTMVVGMLLISISIHANPGGIDTIPLPASIQLFESLSDFFPWLITSNTAAINDLEISSFNFIQINADHKEDDIKFSHQPGKISSFSVETSGLKKIKKTSFLGAFKYLNESYRDLKYNNTLIFDSWNPYIIGDTISGLQNKEQFELNAIAGYKFSSRISVSIGADYLSATGDKQKDPRNLNTIASLVLKPGVIYKIGNYKIGLSASVFNYSDKVSIDIEGNSFRRVFEFIGLGSYRSGVETSSYTNWYLGKGFSGGFQTSYQKNRFKNIFDIAYKSSKEETRSGTNYRLLDGVTNMSTISFNNRIEISDIEYYHIIDICAEKSRLYGDEYLQRPIIVNHFDEEGKVTYTTTEIKTDYCTLNKNIIDDNSVTLNYKYIKLRKSGLIDYQAGGSVKLNYFSRGHYPVENNGLISSTNITFKLNFRKTLPIKDIFFSPFIESLARINISSESDLPSKLPVYCFKDIISNDFNAMSSKMFGASLNAEVEKNIGDKLIRTFYVIPVVSYFYSPDFDYSSSFNLSGSFTLGFTF